MRCALPVSIHAPVKGATVKQGIRPVVALNVSIHAPVKGATDTADSQALSGARFNPRSREGSDGSPTTTCAPRTCFNPRSREGSDPTLAVRMASHISFNPRSREGSDGLAAPAWAEDGDVSIHAPVKGATASRHDTRSTGRVSIHAPVKGATPRRSGEARSYQVFQSTLP